MNKKRIWLIVILVLLLLCAIAGFLVFRAIGGAMQAIPVDSIADEIEAGIDEASEAVNETADMAESEGDADIANTDVNYDAVFAILSIEDYCKVLTAADIAEYFNEGPVVQVSAVPEDDEHIYCYYWFESGSYLSLYVGALADESLAIEEYQSAFVEKYGSSAEELNGNFSEGFWNSSMMAVATRNTNIIALAQLTSLKEGLRESLWFLMDQYYAYLGEISE